MSPRARPPTAETVILLPVGSLFTPRQSRGSSHVPKSTASRMISQAVRCLIFRLYSDQDGDSRTRILRKLESTRKLKDRCQLKLLTQIYMHSFRKETSAKTAARQISPRVHSMPFTHPHAAVRGSTSPSG